MEASAIVLDFPERPTFASLRANVKALYIKGKAVLESSR